MLPRTEHRLHRVVGRDSPGEASRVWGVQGKRKEGTYDYLAPWVSKWLHRYAAELGGSSCGGPVAVTLAKPTPTPQDFPQKGLSLLLGQQDSNSLVSSVLRVRISLKDVRLALLGSKILAYSAGRYAVACIRCTMFPTYFSSYSSTYVLPTS